MIVFLNSQEDVSLLQSTVEFIEKKEWTIIRMSVIGSLSLSVYSILTNYLHLVCELFGTFEVKSDALVMVPDDTDFTTSSFTGFAAATTHELRNKMK